MQEWINDDCFKVLPTLEDKLANLIFTSVPDLNDLGMDNDMEGYEKFLMSAFTQFSRIIKDDGFVALCQTDRKMNAQVFPKHCFIIDAMKSLGFILKDYKIIVKNSFDNKDQFVFPYQHLCVFTRKGTITRSGDWMKHILLYKVTKSKIGPFYGWNPEFVRLVIGSLTKENQLVIDPFSGSGIVVKTAGEMNRQYLGIEIDEILYKEVRMIPESPLSEFYNDSV